MFLQFFTISSCMHKQKTSTIVTLQWLNHSSSPNTPRCMILLDPHPPRDSLQTTRNGSINRDRLIFLAQSRHWYSCLLYWWRLLDAERCFLINDSIKRDLVWFSCREPSSWIIKSLGKEMVIGSLALPLAILFLPIYWLSLMNSTSISKPQRKSFLYFIEVPGVLIFNRTSRRRLCETRPACFFMNALSLNNILAISLPCPTADFIQSTPSNCVFCKETVKWIKFKDEIKVLILEGSLDW